MLTAGVLFEEMWGISDDASYVLFNPSLGQSVPVFPQGQGRVRAYFCYHSQAPYRLQGERDVPRLIEESSADGRSSGILSGGKSRWPAGHV